MRFLWTWSGNFFGYRTNNSLITHAGRHIGKFYGNEIYDVKGRYLGEVKNESRLIYCISKRAYRKHPFTPAPQKCAIAIYASYCGYVMYAGYEDFNYSESK